MIQTVKQYVALNDADGNPRRLFVGYDSTGTAVDVADEGYKGLDAAPWVREYAKSNLIKAENITVAEYKAMVRREA